MRSISLQPKNTKNNITKYLFSGSVYDATLRRRWAEGLLYAIFVLLAFPLLILFITSNHRILTDMTDIENAERLMRNFDNILGTESVIALLWGAASGVLSSMLSLSYLFDRRQSGFVCALPVKRSAYAISSAVSGLCTAVVSWLPATVLLLIGTLCTPYLRMNFGKVMLGFFGAFITYLCVFLFFFGLTALAAALCGTLPMTVLMTAFLSFYPLLLHLMLMLTGGSFIGGINWDYYLRTETFSKISSIVRIFSDIAYPKTVGYLLSTAGLGILYFAIFVLLTVKRKNENTGQHFVWSQAREVVKYLCMLLCGIIGGLIFHELASSSFAFVWMLIGTTIGVFLAWMLCNLVFFKTSTMLFYAKRGMGILLACVLVFLSLMSFDVLGIKNFVPSANMTSSIDISTDSGIITVKDKALIRMYRAMLENGIAAAKNGTIENAEYISPESFGIISSFDGPLVTVTPATTDSSAKPYSATQVTTVFHTKYGISISRADSVLTNDYRTFIAALAQSDGFITQFLEPLYTNAKTQRSSYASVSFLTALFENNKTSRDNLTEEDILEFASIYERELRALGDNPMQNQIVGYIRFYDINSPSYPIFAPCTETIAWLEQHFKLKMLETESATELAKHVVSISLKRGEITQKELSIEEFLAYLESGALSYDADNLSKTYTRHFTIYDPIYRVRVCYSTEPLYDRDDLVDMGAYEGDVYETATHSYNYCDYYFFEGKAPKS